jgi:hypothetical protein
VIAAAPSAKPPARAKKAPPAHEPPLALSHLSLRGDITAVGSLPGEWHRRSRLDWPTVLSFDVGRESAWCILSPDAPPILKRFEGGTIGADFTREVREALDIAKARAAGSNSPLLVACEDVFVARAAPNIAVSLHLARQVGAIVGICAEDAAIVRVLARQWQAAVLGSIRRDQGKKLSVLVARQRISRDIASDHVADAALLALYVRGGG